MAGHLGFPCAVLAALALIVVSPALAQSGGSGSSTIQQQVLGAGEQLSQARLAVAQADFFMLAAKDRASAIALGAKAYRVLIDLAGPDNVDTVRAAKYALWDAMDRQRWDEAERIARERVRAIPAVLAQPELYAPNWTSNQMKGWSLRLWSAQHELAKLLVRRGDLSGAVPIYRAALDSFLSAPLDSYFEDVTELNELGPLGRSARAPAAITLRAEFADVLQQSGDPSLVREATLTRLEEIRLRSETSSTCTPELLAAVRKLSALPSDPSVNKERQDAILAQSSTCPELRSGARR